MGCKRPLYLIFTVVSLSGCGTLWQMPTQDWVNQQEAADNSFDAAMHETPGASDHTNHNSDLLPLVEPESKTPTTRQINIARTINQAIAALGKGNRDLARTRLMQVLAADPDNASAKEFLEQIDTDPIVYFGPEYFEYTARRGDSMTRIADRFLKNHLKFYILTRYSGMENPASLVKGQVVRIPLQYKPAIARQAPAQTNSKQEPVNDKLRIARAHLDQQHYVEAINILEALNTSDSTKTARKLLEAAYAGEAAKLERSGELKRAALLYKKAARLNPDENAYEARITSLSNQTTARDHQRLASLYLKSGQLDLAMENINASLELVPDSEAGRTLYQKIKADVVKQHHTRALELFQDDRFEEALTLWEKALMLDPTHLLSRSYHERCKTMLDRQQEFALTYTEE